MVDPLKYSYYLVLVTEKKKKYDITNFVEDLGWEELENELAARLSCVGHYDQHIVLVAPKIIDKEPKSLA